MSRRLNRDRGASSSDDARLSTFRYSGERFVVLGTRLPPPTLGDLTPSETEVLAYVARGMSNAEVARARQTSVRTVANQVASLFRKTGATSRAELSRIASRGG